MLLQASRSRLEGSAGVNVCQQPVWVLSSLHVGPRLQQLCGPGDMHYHHCFLLQSGALTACAFAPATGQSLSWIL